MRVRQTSHLAYSTIKNNGLLSERRLQVYEALFLNGPLTRNELSDVLGCQGININPNLVSSRLNELREMGVVAEAGHKVCPLSKMTVILWDVTDALPKDYKRPKSNLELAKERLNAFAEQDCLCPLIVVDKTDLCARCVARDVLNIMSRQKGVA